MVRRPASDFVVSVRARTHVSSENRAARVGKEDRAPAEPGSLAPAKGSPHVKEEQSPHDDQVVSIAVCLGRVDQRRELRLDPLNQLEAAERLLAVELVPVIAHPERSLGLGADFGIARALIEQGCLLCPNGDSALGDNGPVAEQAFWRLVDEGLVALVASGGHRRQRPPRLDHAHRVLVERYGEASIEVLFDGSAMPWIC